MHPAVAISSYYVVTRLTGPTSVTTAPGVAAALIKSGVFPLPARGTGFGLGLRGGLKATYRFPIMGGNPNLTGPSGDILHTGGIDFVGRGKHLEVGKLDLDLSRLKVTTRAGSTVLSGITVKLDPAAAGALKDTFRLALPTNGSFVFGSAEVTLKA